MRPNLRSLSGAALMLVIIPILAGLLACMQVPIGNPERSRVDPSLSGTWVMLDDADNVVVMMLDPWDKRTWIGLYGEPDVEIPDGVEIDHSTYDGLIAAMGGNEAEEWYVELTSLMIEKVWLTELGGRTFMVWESKGAENEEDGIAFGYNFLLTRHDTDHFSLNFINVDHDVFTDVDLKDRKSIEKVIRKNASNTELYDMDGGLYFSRVQEQHVRKFDLLFQDVVDEP